MKYEQNQFSMILKLLPQFCHQVIRDWIVSSCAARGWVLSDGAEVALWATVVSAFVAGAALGVAFASYLTDAVGRLVLWESPSHRILRTPWDG